MSGKFLYLSSYQKSKTKPNLIDHYGILDIGNILNHPQGNGEMPIVIHQAIPYVRIDWLMSTGCWETIGKVKDSEIENAKIRIRKAIKNPSYNLFGNNCEHFARYVVAGIRESKQLQTAVGVATVGTLLYLV
ncbi:hypothetical protein CO110_00130 [Candidatus Desantisbacteria bacterium CG_4_9_14_3_um_filter_40_11]|uniref:LRAT domain-containing protein n=2 Tax=unclassified Candidatus Desantisiibacteriota TaxID=3106372 RepID=A0A2M7JEQ8_9BACT|nr:MAG: hypothetical protein COZ71_01050 [Candidatus Desantisbacteria bacterium CG_4_8_14_3_um_filter_40_12]PJB30527.1 MAG: hypothetical protein CO110_00130 [Candidatus Desantisbacteria bacterium CG_4_9_14_3_um_filter_40_11]